MRVLCAKDDAGNFLYGPVSYSRLKDTIETKMWIQAHNDAWDAATNKGELCGGISTKNFGTLNLGSTTWGTK